MDDVYREAARIWDERMTMTLREKQSKFVKMVAMLINYAYGVGYEMTFGCARCAKEGHHAPWSNHYIGLAIDLNLFKNGEYLTGEKGHDVLHDYWDSIGGAPRIKADMNHYSLEHNNVR